MSKEQTAVEWLCNEWLYLDSEFEMKLIDKKTYWERLRGLQAQAKQIEKRQILRAASKMHSKGFDDCINSMNTGVGFNHKEEAKKYYQSKYGKDENKAENND